MIVKQTVGFTFALGALVALNGSPGATAQALPKTMKAIVAHEYGGPDVLKYEDVPLPEPKENEILVRVIASGVNPADPLVIGGRLAKEFGTHLPLIPGYDIAGIVETTGAKVTKFIGRKPNRRSGRVFFHVSDVDCAWDRDNPWLLCR